MSLSFKIRVVERTIKTTVNSILKKQISRYGLNVDFKVPFNLHMDKRTAWTSGHGVLPYIDLETDSFLISVLQISWRRFLDSSFTDISRCIFFTSTSHFSPPLYHPCQWDPYTRCWQGNSQSHLELDARSLLC